jgi:MFS family permease
MDDVRAHDRSATAPFRHAVFRRLWIAQFASNVGTYMQAVGAVWVMIDLKGSPTEVALVQTATTLPVVLLGIVGGALADLVDRRRLLLVTQAVMLLSAAALAVLDAADAVSPESLLVLTFALGAGVALNNPAWQAIQPQLVPRDEFPQAVTLGSASLNLGRAIGPAVGGVLVALAGAWFVFGLNAVSFGAVMLALWWWRRDPDRRDGPGERFGGAVRAGIRYAMHSRPLASVLVRAAVFSFASAGLMALLPVYATATLDLGSGGFGLLLGAFGVGAVAAAFLLPRLRGGRDEDTVVAAGTLVLAATMLGLALTDSSALALVLSVIGGGGWLCCLSTFNVASQQVLPDWVRARGLSFFLTFLMGGIAAGSAAWGVVASHSDVPTAFAWGALAVALTPLLAIRWKLRTAETLDLSATPMMFAAGTQISAEPTDGPILVTLTYTVLPDQEQEFLAAMRRLREARRSTGASSWSVYRDMKREHDFIETFVVPTWGEHLRQHARRTADDADLQEALRPYLVDGVLPNAHHYIAPGATAPR